jgi:hypothetical protein
MSYVFFAKAYPKTNNVIIATLKTGAADIVAQTVIEGKPVDKARPFVARLISARKFAWGPLELAPWRGVRWTGSETWCSASSVARISECFSTGTRSTYSSGCFQVGCRGAWGTRSSVLVYVASRSRMYIAAACYGCRSYGAQALSDSLISRGARNLPTCAGLSRSEHRQGRPCCSCCRGARVRARAWASASIPTVLSALLQAAQPLCI